MSGYVGDLTAKQEAALEKMKSNLQDVWDELPENDDYFLLRWLRARIFDVKKAEAMLRKHLVIRKKWDFDHLLDWEPPEVLQKYFPGRLCGYDRNGCPIFYDRAGKCDFRGLARAAKKEDFIRCRLQVGEQMTKLLKEQSEKLGRRVDTVMLVYDLEDLTLQKHFYMPFIKIITEVIDYFESNYPEILHGVFIVNVPSIFDICYGIVRPFLNEVTRQKIHKLSGPPEVFSERLRELVEPNELPACYGGTLVGPNGDPRCDALLCAGGDIPEEYFITMPAVDNLKNITVSRASTEQIEVPVKKAGTILRWNFATDSYDIGFGILFKDDDLAGVKRHAGEMEEILATERVNSHLLAQEGSIACEKAGIYVVRFSNRHSWIRTKTVHFYLDLEEPDTEEANTCAAEQGNADS